MTKRFFSKSIFARYLHHSLPARLLGFINHIIKGKRSTVTALHAGRNVFLEVTLFCALKRLFVNIGGNHSGIGTDHVAHEAANASRFILDNKIPRSYLERFSNTGIYAGGFLTLLAKTEDGATRTEKGPDVRKDFGRREFSVLLTRMNTRLFTLATEVT
jgi:hypothetical protein